MNDTRDRDESERSGTKQRILDAARAEFSQKGYAGARVDAIAKAADVNIRMIYYFFGSKQQLLKDVTMSKTAARQVMAYESVDCLEKYIMTCFDDFLSNGDNVRLAQWEALEIEDINKETITSYEERHEHIHKRVAIIEMLQKQGRVSEKFDAAFLHMILVAMAGYPFVFPQLTYLITGEKPDDPKFQAKYKESLRKLIIYLIEKMGPE